MKRVFAIIMKKAFAGIIILMISMGITALLFLLDAKSDPGSVHPDSLQVTMIVFSIYSAIIFLPIFVTYIFTEKEILALLAKRQP